MLSELLCHFHHGFDSSAHGIAAPVIDESSGAGWQGECPEMLKGFFEQVGANAAEVHLHQVLEADPLLAGQVARTLEEDPFGLGEDGLFASGKEAMKFQAPNLIHRFVEVRHDVEAVQNVERIWCVGGNGVEVRFPPITANKSEFVASLFAKPDKEAIDRFFRSLFADPDQATAIGINLVNQGQIFMATAVLDFMITSE
jgi:hypothetical protein